MQNFRWQCCSLAKFVVNKATGSSYWDKIGCRLARFEMNKKFGVSKPRQLCE